MLSAVLEYARIIRDLQSTDILIKLFTSRTIDLSIPGWNSSYNSLCTQFQQNLLISSKSSSSDSQSTSTPPLRITLTKSINILSEKTKDDVANESPVAARMILCLFDPNREISDSWTFTDSDGTQVSITDYIDNLILQNNHKAQQDAQLRPISKIEISILVFVPEQPSFPESTILNSTSMQVDINSKIVQAPEEQATLNVASESKFPPDSTTSPTGPEDGIYYHDPSCFSDGTPLPPSKLVSSGLEFVTADLNFVRPSFAQQVIIDLVSSHHNLSPFTVHGAPFKDQQNPSTETNALPVHLIMQIPSNSLSLLSNLSTSHMRPHIGKQLGTQCIPARNLFWKSWDPHFSINTLPSNQTVKITCTFPHHRPTMTLIASILEGRPLMLSSRIPASLDVDSSVPSMVLIKQGNYIHAITLKEYDDVSLMNLEGFDISSRFDRLTRTLRQSGLDSVIESNTYTWTTHNEGQSPDALRSNKRKINSSTETIQVGPVGRSALFTKLKELQEADEKVGSSYRTTKALERWTRIFPLFEDDTVCFQSNLSELLQKDIIPILLSMTSFEIPMAILPMIAENVNNLARLAQNNDPILFPHTRAAVAKRRELYTQLWTELIHVAYQYQSASSNHSIIADHIRATAPDPSLANAIFSSNPSSSTMQVDEKIKPLSMMKSALGERASSSSPQTAEKDQKAAESQWLHDVATVRHDIVGLKDMSWSGMSMSNPDVPQSTVEFPPNSLYRTYWDSSQPPKNSIRQFP
jgi:hypothetical protein